MKLIKEMCEYYAHPLSKEIEHDSAWLMENEPYKETSAYAFAVFSMEWCKLWRAVFESVIANSQLC